MPDHFQGATAGLESPFTVHFAITPSDSVNLSDRPRALRCNVAGTAVLVDEAGTSLSYTLAVGEVIAGRIVRVNATGTTAILYGMY
jgi:hypothetical protein